MNINLNLKFHTVQLREGFHINPGKLSTFCGYVFYPPPPLSTLAKLIIFTLKLFYCAKGEGRGNHYMFLEVCTICFFCWKTVTSTVLPWLQAICHTCAIFLSAPQASGLFRSYCGHSRRKRVLYGHHQWTGEMSMWLSSVESLSEKQLYIFF